MLENSHLNSLQIISVKALTSVNKINILVNCIKKIYIDTHTHTQNYNKHIIYYNLNSLNINYSICI